MDEATNTTETETIDNTKECLIAVEQALNGFKPVHLRTVDDDHPIINYANNMAQSFEATGDAILAEATEKKTRFYEIAEILRKSARERADEVNHFLANVHAMGEDLETSWKKYGQDQQ
jgi:hypothetical protein